jgi:hypothetical protein
MLNGLPILIVEDEVFLALDLATAIEDIKGIAVGPVATVEAAMALVQMTKVSGAILDANLLDGDVTPLALALIEMAVPFIIHSGTGLPSDLARQYPDLPIVSKPARSTVVLAALLQRISPDRSIFDA